MPKFSRQSVDAFQTKLGQIDDAWQDELNLYDTVRQSFEAIKRARRYKASWEQIADILKEVSHSEQAISPESIRQYYYEFANNPQLLGKKVRQRTSTTGRQEKTACLQPVSQVEPTQLDSSDNSGVRGSAQEIDTVQSQFNLSRVRQ